MFPIECKTIKIMQSWVQITSPCSQGLATCHVTIQLCSVALGLALKLSVEQERPFILIA